MLVQNRNKSVEEIRLSFLTYLVIGLEIPKAVTINLGNKYYSFSEIAASDILFDKLLNLDSLYYGICNSQDNYEKSSMWRFDNSKITSRVKSFKLNEKLSSLKRDYQDKIRHKREVLHSKYSQITRRPLAFYLTKFPEIANLPYFAEIELPDMLLLFLQEGYIDEDYYDYISYFYEGMLSETDNDWILNMKLHRIQDYQYHFNHLENLIKSLKLSHFDHLAILNIDILDYLYEHRVGSLNPKFTAMMKQIKSSDLPQDFLYCYSQFGKHKDEILGEYFTWDEETTWILADEYSHPSQSESLKALWCKYTKAMPDCTQEWLECNFSFLIQNLPIIGEMRVKELISECTFERLSQAPPVLIKTAVLNNSFIISYENMKMILSTLHETSEGHPSFSSIISSGSKELIQYLTNKENISLTLEALVSHEVYEDESGSLFVVNNSDLTEDQKISYLSKQTVKISDISSIEDEYLKLAVANDFILPSWQNASSYYESKGLDEDLRQFIVRGYDAISKSTSEDCIISSSRYWNLCVELFISDKLPSNIHRTLLDSLKFEVPPINSLSTLDSIRFKNLVDSNNIKCEEAFMNCLDNTANLGILIESAPQNYLRYTENKEMQINLHSAIYIFNSSVLSKKEKENIFWTIYPAIISEDVSLKIFASEILTNSNELGHWDGSEILSLVSSEVPVDRKRKLWLKAISKDGKLVPKVLSQMGEDYVEIMNPDKRPTFPNDNFHKSFLTALVNLEYIKSYHPDKKGLRVFH